jgi:hypothetical protein
MDLEKEKSLNITYQKFMDIGLNSPESLAVLDDLVAPELWALEPLLMKEYFLYPI